MTGDGPSRRRTDRTNERGERVNGERSGQGGNGRDYERNSASTFSSSAASASASATGSMGDFRLSGSKQPLSSLGTLDSPAGSSKRNANSEERERPWLNSNTLGHTVSREGNAAQGTAASTLEAERRRQVAGDFVKKDGRAAEEGGWRTAREARERDQRTRDRDTGRYNDRTDRDRQPRLPGTTGRAPAWMDDDNTARTTRAERRNVPSSGTASESVPAWAVDSADGAALESSASVSDGALDPIQAEKAKAKAKASRNVPVSTGNSTSAVTGSQANGTHVDSIQAWKAEMKALEQAKRIEQDREIRREMGLPDEPVQDTSSGVVGNTAKTDGTEASISDSLPPKSVFADYLRPAKDRTTKVSMADATSGSSSITATSSASNGGVTSVPEDKPKSSRFARMFDKTSQQGVALAAQAAAAAARSPEPTAQVQAASAFADRSASTSDIASPAPQQNLNPLLAALMPNRAAAPAEHHTSSQPSQPTQPQLPNVPSNSDQASMMRLLGMLHTSSISSGLTPPGSSSSTPALAQNHATFQSQPSYATSQQAPPALPQHFVQSPQPTPGQNARQQPSQQQQPQPYRSTSHGREHQHFSNMQQQSQRIPEPTRVMHQPYPSMPPGNQSMPPQPSPPQQKFAQPIDNRSVPRDLFPSNVAQRVPGILPFPAHAQPLPPRQAQMQSPPQQQHTRMANRLSSGPQMPPVLSPGQYPLPPPMPQQHEQQHAQSRRDFSPPQQYPAQFQRALPGGTLPAPGLQPGTKDNQQAHMAAFLAAQMKMNQRPNMPQQHVPLPMPQMPPPQHLQQQQQQQQVDLMALLMGGRR